jgi:hypothetical protein
VPAAYYDLDLIFYHLTFRHKYLVIAVLITSDIWLDLVLVQAPDTIRSWNGKPGGVLLISSNKFKTCVMGPDETKEASKKGKDKAGEKTALKSEALDSGAESR